MKRKFGMAVLLFALVAALCCGCVKRKNPIPEGYKYALSIGYMGEGYGKNLWQTFAEEYNKAYPDEKIYFTFDDQCKTSDINTRLENESELCDIFYGLATNWQIWAAKGWLENLDDLYNGELENGVTYLESMNAGIRKFGYVNDGYYAVPFADGVKGLVYNQTMFDTNGWEVPETVQDLYDLCDTINALPCNKDADESNDIVPFAWGGQVFGYWDFPVLNWWIQYSGVDAFNEFYEFESPDVFNDDLDEGRKKALTVFRNLICKGNGTPKNSLNGAMGKDHIRMQMDFVNGRAAMIPNGGSIVSETADIAPEGLVMKMMPTPYIDGAKKDAEGNYIQVNNTLGGGGSDFLCVPKAAPNKEAAKKFLRFLATEDMCALFFERSGAPRPFRFDTSKLKDLTPFAQSVLDIWSNSVNCYSVSNSPYLNANYVSTWCGLGEPYTKMVLENKTPKEIVDSCYDYVSKNWAAWTKEINMG